MKQKIHLFLQYLLLLAGILVPIFLIHQYILKGRTILLPDKRINAIAIDSKDRVWVATYGGLFMIENKTTTPYDINGQSMWTTLVGIDENDQVWIIAGTGNVISLDSPAAIYRFDGNSWMFQKEISPFPNEDEIPCCTRGNEMTVTDIQLKEYSPFLPLGSGRLLSDKQGNLWAGTTSGLVRISPNFNPPPLLLTYFHIFLSTGGYWLLVLILTGLYCAFLLDVFSQISLGIGLGLMVFALFSGNFAYAVVVANQGTVNPGVFSILGGIAGSLISKRIIREGGKGKMKKMFVTITGVFIGSTIGFLLIFPWGG